MNTFKVILTVISIGAFSVGVIVWVIALNIFRRRHISQSNKWHRHFVFLWGDLFKMMDQDKKLARTLVVGLAVTVIGFVLVLLRNALFGTEW